MPRYDLHSHSTHSDGLLTPPELVRRAAERGVDVLALTDHDELSGLAEAEAAAGASRLTFVPGTEISVTWRDLTLHVLGLRLDPSCAQLHAGLGAIRAGRAERARRIGASLAEAGIPDAYEGALAFVTSERLVSRTHFARFLVETGHVREMKDVFKRYLARGKPGYVEHAWPALSEAIGWIHSAGGRAVLAHPGRYKLSTGALRALLAEFRDRGGDGLEVLSPSHTADQVADLAAHARKLGLLASSGSDYHGPGESYVDLGDMPELSSGVTPVWHDW
ncbi:MAG TPA: 3',5'-nucleoside bisphosphate phosphatase [Casimicrobiaceae bacterium]|nr:3',5'-nucleoside bisphosphate phosphatase [Casimicrobiaceae bacterium]